MTEAERVELRAMAERMDAIVVDAWVCNSDDAADVARCAVAIPALLDALERKDRPCQWSEDADIGMWETACGAAFTFIVEGPAENEYRHCPSCGSPIALNAPTPEQGPSL